MNRPGFGPNDPAWQVRTLAEGAAKLEARGETAEAEALYRQILATAPHHLRALNFLSLRALDRGALDECQGLLDRALRAAPERPVTHQNLGLLLRARGKLPEALQAMDRALTLKPGLRSAWLIKGSILDELGRKDEAVMAFWRGWGSFPKQEQLDLPGVAPPHLQKLARDTALALRAAQMQLMQQTLSPIRERHGNEALAGVFAAAESYVGGHDIEYVDALQRPSFLYLPGITARPFFERSEFPWSSALEAATTQIRAELTSILDSDRGLAPYVQIEEGVDPQQWRQLNRSRQWSSFHLLKGGERLEDNCVRCPATMESLGMLPLPYMRGHAPEALFSILEPGTHIPPHHGVGNYKLVTHLPLIIPPGCSIRVGNETRPWSYGECLIFDDSYEHEAWNPSTAVRTVLILDVWNPLVSAAEREGIAALVEAISVFNRKYRNAL